MALVSEVLDTARVLLNAQSTTSGIFTNTNLLPVFKIAYRDLQQKMNLNGLSVDREQSANITILAGQTVIAFGATPPLPILPANLLYPIELAEKISGQPDATFVLMQRTDFVPALTQVSTLGYWSWIGEEIRLLGSTNNVPIRIRYFKDLAVLEGDDDIPITDSDMYLAYKTASIAAYTIGGMPSKGQILESEAEEKLDDFLGIGVSNRQAMPVRRRGFRSFNRGFWSNW